MEDLSHLFSAGPIAALVPTSQGGGGVPHENRANTAPGGASPSEDSVQPAPVPEAQQHEERHIVHGGRPVLRIVPDGQWHDLTGNTERT